MKSIFFWVTDTPYLEVTNTPGKAKVLGSIIPFQKKIVRLFVYLCFDGLVDTSYRIVFFSVRILH